MKENISPGQIHAANNTCLQQLHHIDEEINTCQKDFTALVARKYKPAGVR
jgi:hypothetical protein